jgi:membrane fusion protein (multidrug efflux system)
MSNSDASATPTATPISAPATPAPAKRGPGRKILLTVVVAGIAVWLVHFLYDLVCYEETDDAYVTSHLHLVAPQTDGIVQAVLVSDNQSVKAGDVLVRLDPLEFDLALRRATAGVAQAKADEARADAADIEAEAQIAQAQARVGQSRAQLGQAQAQLDLAQINRNRARQLFHDGNAVTQSDLDNAESADAVARAALAAAQANVKAQEAAAASANASLAAARAQGVAARAATAAGEAAVADAVRKRSYATITAPVDGRVGAKNVEAGNRVQAGQTLLALVEPRAWVVANFKETQLARLKAGLPVELTIDALPGHAIRGTIDSIAPASGAEFALLPADNATGNFTKVVQRVPVKITLDPASIAGIEDRIRPGLSAVVSIKVR